MGRLLDAALARLSPDRRENRNAFWLIAAWIALGGVSALSTGAVSQAFLVAAGLSNTRIGAVGAAGNIAYALATILLLGAADRVRRPVRAYTLSVLAPAVYPVGMTAVTLACPSVLPPAALPPVVAALTVAHQVAVAYQVLVGAGIYVLTLRTPTRGPTFGAQGVMIGVSSLLFAAAATRALDRLAFPHGFTVCFAAAALLTGIGAWGVSKLRPLADAAAAPGAPPASLRGTLVRLLGIPAFRTLAGPNFVRGLTSGFAPFVMPVAVRRLGVPPSFAGLVAAAGAVGVICGDTLVGLFHNRWGAARGSALGCVVAAAGAAGLVLFGTPAGFIAACTVLAPGMEIEANAVPLGILEVSPRETVAAFFGVRLMLTMAGTAVSSIICGGLLDRFDPLPVFLGAAALRAANGPLWLCAFNRVRRTSVGAGRETP